MAKASKNVRRCQRVYAVYKRANTSATKQYAKMRRPSKWCQQIMFDFRIGVHQIYILHCIQLNGLAKGNGEHLNPNSSRKLHSIHFTDFSTHICTSIDTVLVCMRYIYLFIIIITICVCTCVCVCVKENPSFSFSFLSSSSFAMLSNRVNNLYAMRF